MIGSLVEPTKKLTPPPGMTAMIKTTETKENVEKNVLDVPTLPHAQSPQWLEFLKAVETSGSGASHVERLLPNWWLHNRKTARNEIKASGFPTMKREDWKYTSLSRLHGEARKIIQGRIDIKLPKSSEEAGVQILSLSELEIAISRKVTVQGLDEASLMKLSERMQKTLTRNSLGFAGQMCRSFVNDPLIMIIPQGYKSRRPLTVNWKAGAAGEWSQALLYIHVAKDADMSLTEIYGENADAQTIQTVFFLEENARMNHLRLQQGTGGIVLASLLAELSERSKFHTVQVSGGSSLSREDLYVEFRGKRASAWTDGVYFGKRDDLLDHHTNVDHFVGETEHRQLYKGILADESHGVFNGRVVIHRGASGSDSAQLNRNLLLSKKVQIDTKPELLIDNDDVKATHGAAIGRLDKEHLFYLQSRGIPTAKALAMLARGFAREVVDRLESAPIREMGRDAVNVALLGIKGEDA